jgi:ribose-phosphate pyrophosphokinase
MALKILSGNAYKEFAESICKHLNVPLSESVIKTFPDSETYVKCIEKVRGDDVFVIQPTSRPVNQNLMELLVLIDALKRSSVKRINVVMPFYGYARQDRRASAREPITAKLVANLLTTAGTDRIITVDLHSPQIVGFFDIDVDHFEAYPLFAEYFSKKNLDNLVVVSSDAGFAKKARKFAKILDTPLAIIDKRRKRHSHAEIGHVIGDVENKNCILIDDLIDTAGTTCAGIEALYSKGAKSVYVAATHGVLSNDAIEKLDRTNAKEILFTDTIPIDKSRMSDKFKIISITELMAQVIQRIHDHKSLGELFSWEEKVNVKIN